MAVQCLQPVSCERIEVIEMEKTGRQEPLGHLVAGIGWFEESVDPFIDKLESNSEVSRLTNHDVGFGVQVGEDSQREHSCGEQGEKQGGDRNPEG